MKKILLLGLITLLFLGCEQKDTRYTQQSPEIDIVKAVIEGYNTKNYDVSTMVDTCKTFFNSKTDAILKENLIAYHQSNDVNYSKRMFLEKDQDFEMVTTDEGHVWVNAWLDWQGTLAGNGKTIDIPIHLTYRFIDQKIIRVVGMWDPTEIVLNLQEMEAQNNMSTDEKTINKTIETIIKAWNTNDKVLMANAMTDNMVRTENGIVSANNPSEYGTNLMDVFFGGFPDFKVTLDNSKIIDNKAIITWTCTGTNTSDFEGKTTNKPIITHGMSVWTVEKNGKASREDAYYDNLTLFQQLGYMPDLN